MLPLLLVGGGGGGGGPALPGNAGVTDRSVCVQQGCLLLHLLFSRLARLTRSEDGGPEGRDEGHHTRDDDGGSNNNNNNHNNDNDNENENDNNDNDNEGSRR